MAAAFIIVVFFMLCFFTIALPVLMLMMAFDRPPTDEELDASHGWW